jgi:hypothetical protein
MLIIDFARDPFGAVPTWGRDRAEIVDCPDCGRPLGVCASPACAYSDCS